MAQERMKVIFGHLGQRDHRAFATSPISSTGLNINSGSSEFQFTLDDSKLTYAQRAFYEENGFLVIPNLVPHDLIDNWKNRFLDLVEGRVDTAGMTKMKDVSLKGVKGVSGELIVNKIQDFVWDEILSEHCRLPQVLDYVQCFTGPNIMAMHTMLINKPPDPGTRTSRHPLHQDLHYFPFRPANRIVCAWTAMEKINEDNGCLFVLPGSHKGKLEQHDYPDWEDGVNKMYHGVRGFDDEPKAMLSMEKGDTVFFHPILLHGSGDNRTKHFRKAISCHYAASECDYIDVRGTTQENIAKEVEEIAARRGVDGLTFREIWKFRSRLVRGQEAPPKFKQKAERGDIMAQERMKIISGHLGRRDHHAFTTNPVSSVGSSTSIGSTEFEYTLENPRLNYAQRAFYEENGFLVIPNMVPHHLIDMWKNRFLDLVEGRDEVPGMTKMKDVALLGVQGVPGELVVNKIQDFAWDESLSQHCFLPEILDIVECFTGPNIMAMHTMLINKPPDPGTRTSRHPLHQDLHYFPFRPANRIVCAWTAMEKITEDNGCLFVVPGSHKGQLHQHDYPEWEGGVNKMYHGVRGFDDSPKTMLCMEKGDTVFFHPVLLHGSGDNRTKHFRKAISCHYAASDCHWIDVRGTTQEMVAKEVEALAVKKGAPGLTFKDIWKIRSRLVRGDGLTIGESLF